MAKIKDKKKLEGCLVNYDSGKISQKWASKYLEITPRRLGRFMQSIKQKTRYLMWESTSEGQKRNCPRNGRT